MCMTVHAEGRLSAVICPYMETLYIFPTHLSDIRMKDLYSYRIVEGAGHDFHESCLAIMAQWLILIWPSISDDIQRCAKISRL